MLVDQSNDIFINHQCKLCKLSIGFILNYTDLILTYFQYSLTILTENKYRRVKDNIFIYQPVPFKLESGNHEQGCRVVFSHLFRNDKNMK